MVDLWNAQGFRSGLIFGLVAAAALLVIALVASARRSERSLPLAGAVLAAGGLWSISESRNIPSWVVLGLIGVGVAGALTHVQWIPRWCCVVLAVPFAAAIGFRGELVADTWLGVLVTISASGGALLAAEFDHGWRTESAGLTLLGVSVLGVYATVPDTESVAPLVGVVLPLLVLGWPVRFATLGRAGAPAAVALLMWAGAVGAEGRPASIIAAVACLGLLVGSPVGWIVLPRVGERFRRSPRAALMLCLVVSHVVIVLVASRVGGPLSDPEVAATVGALVGLTAVLIGAAFRPPSPAVSRRVSSDFGDGPA